jgi:hypothetical protein
MVETDKFCLKPSAEVLTESGWVTLENLNINNSKVATMDQKTFELKYINASEKNIFDYDSTIDGKMYYFKSKSIHTISTPNHKHFVKGVGAMNYRFTEAKELVNKRIKFKKNCINNFSEFETISLLADDGEEYEYPMNTYLKLLGMFISDGYTSDFQIKLCMRKQRKLDYIRSLENDLGFTFNYNEIRFVKVGKRKAKGIFEEFKKLSVGSINKRLPDYVWDMGIENCKSLLDGLINGDGTVTPSGTQIYCTSSKLLADDIQRLIFHCGYVGTIQIGSYGGRTTTTETKTEIRTITQIHDNYKIVVNKKELEPTVKDKSNSSEEKWIDYKGEVMCIEVPETHLFYYRENKLSPPMWTGNSSRAG